MVGEGKILKMASQAGRTFQLIMSQDLARTEEGDEFEFQIYKNDWRISREKGKYNT